MLQPLFGLLALIALAWGLSTHRRRVRWRPVAGGVLLQWLLAAVILLTPAGAWFFAGAQAFFLGLIDAAKEGGRAVLGEGVLGTGGGPVVLGAVIVVTVVFFSSVFALLHHAGAVRLLVGAMARVMARTMRTSGSESTCAAANIFVGQTEAPLLVRPYLPRMTRSEIGAVMTVGFATVAGGVFAVYVEMLRGAVDDVAGHLLAATVMSAPMGLAMAKIVFPETEQSETLGRDVAQPPSTYENAVDAVASGAADGMKLALNILAMLIAFLGLLEVINWALGAVSAGLTLQQVFGTLFAPLAWLLGVPAAESREVGALLGTKIAVNEYVAFAELGQVRDDLSQRSRVIASYALCGFANFSSIAIQIGGLGTIAPQRRGEIARLGLRAMAAGALTSFATAATAALFLT